MHRFVSAIVLAVSTEEVNVKKFVAIVALTLSIAGTGYAQAAPPHTITWTPRSAAPGAIVTLGGQQFVLVRLPVRDLGGSRRFSVSFLAARNGSVVAAPLVTLHSREPLGDPIEIDGFDATVSVTDGRTYNLLTNFTSPGDYTFSVNAHASCTVNIKAGQTLITLIGFISVVQQPAENIGSTPNAVPHADWAAFVHPGPQITACNNWIDYVRIQELN